MKIHLWMNADSLGKFLQGNAVNFEGPWRIESGNKNNLEVVVEPDEIEVIQKLHKIPQVKRKKA